MLYIINFKTYKEGTSEKAINLAKIISEISKEKEVEIWAVPQFTDLKEVASIVPSISQHIDPISSGAHTGAILPLAIKSTGAIGTLINHSERRIGLGEIEKCIKLAKELGLKTICCAEDIEKVMEIAKFKPDYIAYEPPELIGSGKSVSQEKPDVVEQFVGVLSDIDSSIIPLCGAGVSDREDVEMAKKLGTRGVLVASAIVKTSNQRVALNNLVL